MGNPPPIGLAKRCLDDAVIRAGRELKANRQKANDEVNKILLTKNQQEVHPEKRPREVAADKHIAKKAKT